MTDNLSIVTDGYQALQSGAALLDLSSRGRIYATGEDRARLIHALSTNHIQELQPGQGAYAFFLTAQGRILADAHILCFDDKLLLDVEPQTAATLYRHIDHYIIADDVTLEDASDTTFAFGLEGPGVTQLLTGLGAALPLAQEEHIAWENFELAKISATGASGFRIFGSKEDQSAMRERLVASGAVPASDTEARIVRIEHGVPRYGEDISNTTLPQETGLANALHFRKGCYLGQEIVERIRSRGHVNRKLTPLVIEALEPVAEGAKVMAEDAEAGEITSSAYSPARGKVCAIAMMRVQSLRPDARFQVAAARARIA